MAKCVITITDIGDEQLVDIRTDLTPPFPDPDSSEGMTPAQSCAAAMLNAVVDRLEPK